MTLLLKSRKFWLAVFGVLQAIVLHYLNVPDDIWQAIAALVGVLIASIAVEDAGAKIQLPPPTAKP
jgi:nicotinamide riboside transporter PnuC